MTGLTTKQAAALIGVSEQTVKGWIRRGVLPQTCPGRRGRLLPEDVYSAQRLAHHGDILPRWREDPVRYGQRLRSLREMRGLTQLDLASRSGLCHEGISRIERGDKTPQARTIMQLCAGLDVDPMWLVTEEPTGMRMLSTAEAAAYLGVSEVRFYRWMRDGVLPGTKVGGRWRIPAVAVYDLARSGRLRGTSRRLDG